MAKPKQPLIPVTKNVAPPSQAQGPSVADWVAEGHARIRQENANNVFLGNLIDQLFGEIVKRDKMLEEAQKPKE